MKIKYRLNPTAVEKLIACYMEFSRTKKYVLEVTIIYYKLVTTTTFQTLSDFGQYLWMLWSAYFKRLFFKLFDFPIVRF
jgi:hypothetical protein